MNIEAYDGTTYPGVWIEDFILHIHMARGDDIHAIKYLSTGKVQNDIMSSQLAVVGVVFGILGMITGMFWATFTWGEPWRSDPKQNASAIGLLIYFAYGYRKSHLGRGLVEVHETDRDVPPPPVPPIS